MSGERGNVGRLLADEVEAPRVDRLWKGVNERKAGLARRRTAVRVVGVAFCAAIAIALVYTRAPAEVVTVRLADGTELAARLEEPGRIVLSDSSVITIDRGANLREIANGRERIELDLERGRARFEVTEGTGRRWVVRSGTTTVEVLGTIFSVDRRESSTEVRVERGRVRVTGPGVLEGEQFLERGESIVVAPAAPPVVAPSIAPPAFVTPAPPAPVFVAPVAPIARSPVVRSPATEALVVDAPPLDPCADLDTQLDGADAARVDGRLDDAVDILERASTCSGSRAALAAVTLGRLEMDRLARPDRARLAFERAEQLGIPLALRTDVERRLASLRAAP